MRDKIAIMLRRLLLVFAATSMLASAKTSYDRLAAAVKLWPYIKYTHPGVTDPAIPYIESGQ